MRFRTIADRQINYGQFDNPYTGLAAMIFVQAAADVSALDGNDSVYRDGSMISRGEILNFLRSEWAAFLASAVGIERKDLAAFEERKLW